MPAPKGHKKWGGRKKGTLNKTKQQVLDLVREKSGTTPAEVLAAAMNDPAQKLWAAKELMPYCYAKRAAVEVSEDPENPLGEAISEKTMEFAVKILESTKERNRG